MDIFISQNHATSKKEVAVQEEVSTFARMVDKLRMMNEAELKLAYIRLIKEDLAKQWETITSEATFGEATDEDIVAAIQEIRYPQDHA